MRWALAAWLLVASAASAEELDLRRAKLAVRGVDGAAARLAPLLGRLTLINLWATWCEPCRSEMPALAEAARRFAGRGVKVVGLAIDDAKAVAAFVKEHPPGYPVLVGDEALASRLGADEGLPTTLVVDDKGAVTAILVGALDAVSIRQQIEAALPRQRR